jgi:hypothetical protein
MLKKLAIGIIVYSTTFGGLIAQSNAQTKIDLTGEWILKTQDFKMDSTGSICVPVPNQELVISPILVQQGNQITSDSSRLILNEGRISNHSVYMESEVFRLQGNLSDDGNTVIGNLSCLGGLNQPSLLTKFVVSPLGL